MISSHNSGSTSRWSYVLGASALLLSGLLLVDCKGETSPDDAYRTFVAAVASHDADKAFSLLSEGTRQKLEALAKNVSKETQSGVPPDPRRMIVSGDPAAKPIKELKVVSRTDDAAVLSVDDGSGPREVKMVREGLRWKVNLDVGS